MQDISLVVRMRKKGRVVGFYKDKLGETHPITKSERQIKQRKVIQGPKLFRGVRPKSVARYVQALRFLEDPRIATIEACRENKVVFSKPATLIMRNHVQGLLTEGQIDRLTLKDVKGNVLFDSEIQSPRASRHWFVVINGIVSGDFRSKTPMMSHEAIIIAKDIFSRQLDIEHAEIAVCPE
jgi:hypothetical protein